MGTVDGTLSLPAGGVIVRGTSRAASWVYAVVSARVVASHGGETKPAQFPRGRVALLCTLTVNLESLPASVRKPVSWEVESWPLDGSLPDLPSLPDVVSDPLADAPVHMLRLPLLCDNVTPKLKTNDKRILVPTSFRSPLFTVSYELVVSLTTPRGATDMLNYYMYLEDGDKCENYEEWGVPVVRLPVWVTDNPGDARDTEAGPPRLGADKPQQIEV